MARIPVSTNLSIAETLASISSVDRSTRSRALPRPLSSSEGAAQGLGDMYVGLGRAVSGLDHLAAGEEGFDLRCQPMLDERERAPFVFELTYLLLEVGDALDGHLPKLQGEPRQVLSPTA